MELGLLIQELQKMEKQYGPTPEVVYHDRDGHDGYGTSVDFVNMVQYQGEIAIKLI